MSRLVTLACAALVWAFVFGGCSPTQDNSLREIPPGVAQVPQNQEPQAQRSDDYFGLFLDVAPTQSRHKSNPDATYPSQSISEGKQIELAMDWERVAIAEYKRHHPDTTAEIDSIAEWIELAIRAMYQEDDDKAVTGAMAEASEFITSSVAARDPVVLLYLAKLSMASGDFKTAILLSERALTMFPQMSYPARFPAMAHSVRLHSRKLAGIVNEQDPLIENHAEAIYFWLTENLQETPEQFRAVWNTVSVIFRETLPEHTYVFERLITATSESKSIPAWFKSMLQGSYHNWQGWRKSGAAYADFITVQGWEEFKKNQVLAAGQFQQAFQICPAFPEPAVELMRLALTNESVGSCKSWFDRAVEAQFDYLPAYTTRLESLRPDSGGSSSALLEFGRRCAATKRFDTTVPWVLVLACQEIRRSGHDLSPEETTRMLRDNKLREEVLQCVTGLAEDPAKKGAGFRWIPAEFWLTYQLYCSDLNGDLNGVQKAIGQLKGSFNSEAARQLNIRNSSDLFNATALAANGSHKNEARQLREIMRRELETRVRSADEIGRLTRSALSDSSAEKEHAFFRSVQNRVGLERQYAGGQWVDLQFDREFTIWEASDFRQVAYETPESVAIDLGFGDHAFRLRPRLELPGPKTIEFTVEPIRPARSAGLKASGNACFGAEIGLISGTARMHICLDPLARQIGFGNSRQSELFHYRAAGAQELKRVKVNCDDQYLEVFVDGVFVYRSRPKGFRIDDGIAFGHPGGVVFKGSARMSNLRVRRWSSGAPPLDAGAGKIVDHYTRVLATEEEDGWNWLWRGMAADRAGNFDQALADYQQATARGVSAAVVGFYHGEALDRLGKTGEATQSFDAAVRASDGLGFAPMPLIRFSKQEVNETFWTPQSAATERLHQRSQPPVDPQIKPEPAAGPNLDASELYFSTFEQSLQPRLRNFFDDG